MQMSRVVIAGYVSKKSTLRYLPSGTPVANVRVGDCVRYAEGIGKTRELTNWHSLSFTEACRCRPGAQEGRQRIRDDRIEQRQLISRDGSKLQTVHEIVVSQCHLIAPVRHGNKAAESAAGKKNAAKGSVSTGSGVENDRPIAG